MNLQTDSNYQLDFDEQNVFEGPEKNLQIIFSNSSISLLQISQSRWEKMLENINCSIISSKSNEKCIAFILSESSLFVFNDRIILKTCGTIPLLISTDEIIKIGQSIGLKIAALLYWRKNFIHPEKQITPHNSFLSEVQFLDSRFGKFGSKKIRCGPSSQDHFYFYYVEFVPKSMFRPVFSTFELKMHEIHPEISKNFFIDNCHSNDNENEIIKNVRNVIPNPILDEFFFDPCGYSMNALFGSKEEYETVHITPEANCSYVSFEASYEEITKGAKNWTNKILSLFRPFSVIGVQISSSPSQRISMKQIDGYDEACPIATYNLNGLYVTFWSLSIKEKDSHPMFQIAEIRKKKLPMVTTLDEIGKYSGSKPPPFPKYLSFKTDEQIIAI